MSTSEALQIEFNGEALAIRIPRRPAATSRIRTGLQIGAISPTFEEADSLPNRSSRPSCARLSCEAHGLLGLFRRRGAASVRSNSARGSSLETGRASTWKVFLLKRQQARAGTIIGFFCC